MTPEELGRMTLEDFEAASARWAKAADALREVRALMVPASVSAMPPQPAGAIAFVPAPVHPGIASDPESMAIRERLRQQMQMNRPAEAPEGLSND